MGIVTLTVSGLFLIDFTPFKSEDAQSATIGMVNGQGMHKLEFQLWRNGRLFQPLNPGRNMRLEIQDAQDQVVSKTFGFERNDLPDAGNPSVGRFQFTHLVHLKSWLYQNLNVSFDKTRFVSSLEIPGCKCYASKFVTQWPTSIPRFVTFKVGNTTRARLVANEVKFEFDLQAGEKMVVTGSNYQDEIITGDILTFRNDPIGIPTETHFCMLYDVMSVTDPQDRAIVDNTDCRGPHHHPDGHPTSDHVSAGQPSETHEVLASTTSISASALVVSGTMCGGGCTC